MLMAVRAPTPKKLVSIPAVACGIFSQGKGSGSSLLNYNGSNPSLLKISVQLDRQIIFNCLQTVLVSFEAEFDSNYHILHNSKGDLWQ